MAGEGDFLKPTDQAQVLLVATLQDIATAAKTSLLITPVTPSQFKALLILNKG